MRLLFFAAALTLASAPTPAKKKKERPIKRVDRTRVVGAPVFDDTAKEGVYVWLEDGWFNVTAFRRSGKKKRVSVRVASTKKILKSRGDFSAQRRPKSLTLNAAVGDVPIHSKFKTEGDITVKTSQRLFVGPLAQKAAASITIGRF